MKDISSKGHAGEMPMPICGTTMNGPGSAGGWGIMVVVATEIAIAPWGTAANVARAKISRMTTKGEHFLKDHDCNINNK